MSNTFPITPEQQQLLNRFTCERLTAHHENLYDIQDFESADGEGLVDSLLKQGWSSDLRGTTIYYLIRNPDGEIVMFFSLKCGVLFDPDYVLPYLDAFQETLEKDDVLNRWQRALEGDLEERKYFRNQRDLMGPRKYGNFLQSMRIKADKKQEPNQKIIRVSEARPAIELVEFCANDATKDSWKAYGFPAHRKMGETLFWHFIVPKMLEINSLIGCEFVYLFAADSTVDGSLSNYYRERLHFNSITHLGAIKPSYDFSCFFMGNRLRSLPMPRGVLSRSITPEDLWGLDHYQEAFFQEFNLNPDADDLV